MISGYNSYKKSSYKEFDINEKNNKSINFYKFI